MSYKEKSLLASILISLYVLYQYLNQLIGLSSAAGLNEETLFGLFIEMAIWMAILQIILQSVISAFDAKEANRDDDEMDRLINDKSYKVAYSILTSGVYISAFLIWIAYRDPERLDNPMFLQGIDPIYSILNILVIAFICSELFKSCAQIYYYRRGL